MTALLLDEEPFLNAQGETCVAHLYEHPNQLITAYHPDEIAEAFSSLEKARTEGKILSGFFAYELGYLFEKKLRTSYRVQPNVPLIWFGVFDRRTALTVPQKLNWLLDEKYSLLQVETIEATPTRNMSAYLPEFDRVKNYIAAGDIYQLNLTFKAKFKTTSPPKSLYYSLAQNQPVELGGLVLAPDFSILSFSPELFFEIENNRITVKPMKGTIEKGKTPKENARLHDLLQNDEKNRAENLMITDLMRNDLSRICKPGSVKVPDLFKVESYKSINQMISVVEGQLKPGLAIKDWAKNLFPSGSIIGAPKIRAQEIIRELEQEPRGLYTGSIGTILPNGHARFNVAIRSVFLSPEGDGEIGIGSGIVQDSIGEEEYAECLLKMAFLKG